MKSIMRTRFRSGCLIAALALTGLLSSRQPAQAIVGYVNVTINPDAPVTRTFLANPLNAFPDNHLTNVLYNLPDRSQIYLYRGSPARFQSHLLLGGVWYPETTIDPGEGFILETSTNASFTITFVGEVTLNATTNPIPPGYSLRASKRPTAGGVTTVQELVPGGFDNLFKWDHSLQAYTTSSPYEYFSGIWFPSEPANSVGESFFYYNVNGSTLLWIQSPINPLVGGGGKIKTVSDTTGPTVKNISVSADTVTLDLGQAPTQPYQVEFSSDQINWTVVATDQTKRYWTGPNPGGARGYYQVR